MVLASYQYTTDDGTETYSFLQDTTVAGTIGNTAAGVGIPRIPHKFKPRRVSIRFGTSPFKYVHPIVGAAGYAGLTLGVTNGIGTVVGQDGEVNNGQSAY